MRSAAEDSHRAVVLTTAVAAPEEAFECWEALISQTFVPLVAGPVSAAPFTGAVEHRSIGDVQLSTVRAGAQEVRRSRSLIASGREEYVLASLQVAGTGLVEQDGRRARLAPGSMVFYDSTRPYRLRFEDRFEQFVVQVPRCALPDRALAGATGVALPPTDRIRLVARFLVGLAALQKTDRAGAALLAPQAIGLLRAALGTVTGNASAIGTTPDQRLELILHRLRTAALDPALSADRMAAMCHLSRRSLFRMFKEEPDGFAGAVRTIRVEAAQRHLRADPRRPLATVAAASGFAGVAQLHRAFRDATGSTPAAWRASQPD